MLRTAFEEFLTYIGSRLQKSWRAGLAARAARQALERYVPEPLPEYKVLSMRLPGAVPIFGEDDINHAADVLRLRIGEAWISSEVSQLVVRTTIAALGGLCAEGGPWIVKGTPRPIDIPILGSGHGARQAWIKIDAGDEIAVLRRRRP